MTKLVEATGPLIEVAPDRPLAAIAVRLMRGAIKKDFRDRYELELSLFEFLVACEQAAQTPRDNSGEGERLIEEIRLRVVARLPDALDVATLASEYGMSRTHFSHLFKARTGMSPAHFATEVRVHQATRLLLETKLPLKQIAMQCGFADANYFCKVFRRCQHLSPQSYRRALR
jgi:AraC-like DNA-binding protein